MKYKEDFTGIVASQEEWQEAFEEFLAASLEQLPDQDILYWDYGLKGV